VISRHTGAPEFLWESFRSDDGARLRCALEHDGFAVIRGVLAAAEVDRLRTIVRDHLADRGVRFGLGRSQLASLFTNENIIRLFKTILGEDQVVFTGHCDIHMNMLSGWHKDSGEAFGGYFRGDYFTSSDCRVYKVAVYLQDSDLRTGFAIRPGSHRSPSLMYGDEMRIGTRVGDAVVFDVRVSHAGQLPDLIEKGLKALNHLFTRGDRTKPDSRLAGALKAAYWMLTRRRERLSIFYTFGCANQYTYDFAFANMSRQTKQAGHDDTKLPCDLDARLRTLGVTPYDLSTHGRRTP
jgi:hypothetical protein